MSKFLVTNEGIAIKLSSIDSFFIKENNKTIVFNVGCKEIITYSAIEVDFDSVILTILRSKENRHNYSTWKENFAID